MTKFSGRTFISSEGATELESIRVSFTENTTPGAPPVALLARLPSDDCGCPEELWRIDGLLLLIHFEADREGEAVLYAGDWEQETSIEARSLDDLRAKAIQWHADIVDFSEGN
ncbi:hypothetical protein [Thalassovita sp.]|jgi:hypothetical protein|uniref:hypothetical protein n=1 Tax=Thalassovita sp. TaxID=1979401 RepID=UPI002AB1D65A|nr:hypothetical protein [Thalassovita sp.]